MKIDWGRLILFWLGMYVAQIVIYYVLALMGVPTDSFAFIVLFDLALGFTFSYFYYPSYARRGILRDPDYYKNALIFFLILFIFEIIF